MEESTKVAFNETSYSLQENNNYLETSNNSYSVSRPIGNDYSHEELIEFLKSTVIKYGIDYDEIYSTIKGESNFKPTASGPGSLSIGIAQYTIDTWLQYCSDIDDRTDPYKAIDCMAKMFSKNMKYKWDAYCYSYYNEDCIKKRGLYPKDYEP